MLRLQQRSLITAVLMPSQVAPAMMQQFHPSSSWIRRASSCACQSSPETAAEWLKGLPLLVFRCALTSKRQCFALRAVVSALLIDDVAADLCRIVCQNDLKNG